MKLAFIEERLREFPVKAACRVLGVSRSGYYARRNRSPSPRVVRREKLAAKIEAMHEENRRVYGSPRLHRALLAAGEKVRRNTVAGVMRRRGVRAKSRTKFVPRTTDGTHGRPVASNGLGRDFAAEAPDRKWAADITYVPTGEGWLYLAGVIDLHSRKLVGWSMANHMRAERVADALAMALARRSPGAGLPHHGDRGVQYAGDDYQGLLAEHGIACSMSNKGDCYDNAAMESFWGTLKTELVNHERYETREQARASVFEYIEVFYNRKRLHGALGYLSPEQFEAGLN